MIEVTRTPMQAILFMLKLSVCTHSTDNKIFLNFDITHAKKCCWTYRCQDYILIDRGDFGTTEICGNTSLITRELKLNGGRFKVFFRSSEEKNDTGFQMYVLCFREAERDMPGICELFCPFRLFIKKHQGVQVLFNLLHTLGRYKVPTSQNPDLQQLGCHVSDIPLCYGCHSSERCCIWLL